MLKRFEVFHVVGTTVINLQSYKIPQKPNSTRKQIGAPTIPAIRLIRRFQSAHPGGPIGWIPFASLTGTGRRSPFQSMSDKLSGTVKNSDCHPEPAAVGGIASENLTPRVFPPKFGNFLTLTHTSIGSPVCSSIVRRRKPRKCGLGELSATETLDDQLHCLEHRFPTFWPSMVPQVKSSSRKLPKTSEKLSRRDVTLQFRKRLCRQTKHTRRRSLEPHTKGKLTPCEPDGTVAPSVGYLQNTG